VIARNLKPSISAMYCPEDVTRRSLWIIDVLKDIKLELAKQNPDRQGGLLTDA
jgi:hypothetical protein